jgi:muramoyltetrapeptide carboxypeptidase
VNRQNQSMPTLPRALQPGDTLAVVAPASPFDRQLFDAGIRVLESMRFDLVITEDIFDRRGYLAGTDRQRAARLTGMFADPDIDGIICARGGYGAMRILPLLDADAIRRHPKVFVGFSDITALLGFLVEHCHMIAFHGPTVTTLGSADSTSRERFFAAVTQPTPYRLSAVDKQVVRSGGATGRFFCGNLSLLCHLTGTPFQPDFSDGILLIEDRGEALYRIDRMLTQMMMAGYFDGLAGLALGRFTDCGSSSAIARIVGDRLGQLDIPIMAGFEVGHGRTNLTLPVGLPANLDTASGSLTFTGPALG